jgi:hypothetical protein
VRLVWALQCQRYSSVLERRQDNITGMVHAEHLFGVTNEIWRGQASGETIPIPLSVISKKHQNLNFDLWHNKNNKKHHHHIGAYPKLICVCESQTQITKILLTRHKLVLRVPNLIANRKYL